MRLAKYKFFLWSFGRFKIPLIGYLKSKIVHFDENKAVFKIPLSRRSQNHLHSMYFGALAVGADLAGGFHCFSYIKEKNLKASLVFKSFQAQFIQRPESDVYFVCEQGKEVKAMVNESAKSGERLNKPVAIKAYIHYQDPDNRELVADFILELSVKVLL